jgi:hypothetical protein
VNHTTEPMARRLITEGSASSSEQKQAAQKKETSHKLAWIWLGLGLVGCALRGWVWWNSIGSNDILLWSSHAQSILSVGVARTYEGVPLFNHPPIMGIYAAHAWAWSHGDFLKFSRYIKIPGLTGEALTLWALWRFAGYRAFLAYAWLPAAILVSAYHGSTDCLCAALVLVAAISFDRKQYFLSGLLWSAALNVKLIPLVLVPVVVLSAPKIRDFIRLAIGATIGLLSFIPPALTAGHAMYRNMIAYHPVASNWGITALLNTAGRRPSLHAASAAVLHWYGTGGRYILLASVLAVALLSKFRCRLPMTMQAALGSALFLVFAPGFGIQYVVFAAPLLCFVDLTTGLIWGWMSGLVIGYAYWVSLMQTFPFQSTLTLRHPFLSTPLGLLAWAVLVHFVWKHARAAWKCSPQIAGVNEPSAKVDIE